MPKKSKYKTSTLQNTDSEQAIQSTNYTQSRTKLHNASQSQLTNGFSIKGQTFRNTTNMQRSSSRSPTHKYSAEVNKSKSSLTRHLIPSPSNFKGKKFQTTERKKQDNDETNEAASGNFEQGAQDRIKQKFMKKQGETYNLYSQYSMTNLKKPQAENFKKSKSRNLSLNIDTNSKILGAQTSVNSPITHLGSDRVGIDIGNGLTMPHQKESMTVDGLSEQSLYQTIDIMNSKKKRIRGLRSETVSDMFRQQEQTPGFHSIIGLGPSMLLQQSGSKSSIPKMGDYHSNIKKNSKYVNAGPGHYHLPSLFDNYQPNKDLNAATQHSHNKITANHQLLRNAPQSTFSIKSPVARIISKQHDHEQMGLLSPGVGTYSPPKGTFEIIKQKGGYEFGMGKKMDGSHDGFGKQTRFHQPKRSWVETVPVGYMQVESNIGKIAQAKYSPKISSTTMKHYELSRNRTYFGIPAKCEGPGPHLNPQAEKAFQTVSPIEQTLHNKQSQSKIQNFQDRFDISGILAHKEYAKGLQAYTSGHQVPGSKYEFEVSDIVGPKRIKSIAQGTQQRQSNYLPEKTDPGCSKRVPDATTYDVQSKYGYINVTDANNELRRLQKELSRSPKNADIQQQILDLPEVKTSYRIRGGQFPLDYRKCSEF